MHYYSTEELIRMDKSLKILATDNNSSIDRKEDYQNQLNILQQALNTNCCDVVRAFDYIQYLKKVKKEVPAELSLSGVLYPITDIEKMYQNLDPSWIPYARSFNRSVRQRKKRLKDHMEQIFDIGNCIFVTLTFRDDVLEKTSESTRRQYVFRTLKKMSDFYIANIDYGQINEREHYHAIVVSDFVDMTLWKHGFIFVENCLNNERSLDQLSNYITKLTNHGLKKGTRYKHIIYSH